MGKENEKKWGLRTSPVLQCNVVSHQSLLHCQVLQNLKSHLDGLPEDQRATVAVPDDLLSPVQTRVISNLYGERFCKLKENNVVGNRSQISYLLSWDLN